jgi:hypothetical protein
MTGFVKQQKRNRVQHFHDTSCARVVAMECSNLQPGINLSIYLPAVMTCIIALPLDEILKSVVPHAAIKDFLYLILLVAVDKWWRVMSMT